MSNEQLHKTVDVTLGANPQGGAGADSDEQTSTMIVVSKVKGFIRERAGLNTSKCAVDALSKKVMEEAIKGIERAKDAGRKTLMGKDIL